MVLSASDELRHPWDDDPLWRESWYYNFSDPEHELGAWLYFWVTPNQPMKSGMLVSIYHGISDGIDSNAAAWSSPGHLYRGPAGNWVYCYKEDFPDLLEEDVDDAELGGFRMKRLEPLKRTKLTFADGDNASFEFNCEFMTRPWDFADNIHPTPPWLAKNRYHRGWKVDGEFVLAGKSYRIKTTGDSDHSWGTRDGSVFGRNNLKTYAIQSPDGGLSAKAQLLGDPGHELARGYIAHGEDMQAMKSIEESSHYRESGLMEQISLRLEDVKGRVVEAQMDSLYAALDGGRTSVGFEGGGVWDVKDWGRCAGLASCWWAAGITREQLHKGEAGKTLPAAS